MGYADRLKSYIIDTALVVNKAVDAGKIPKDSPVVKMVQVPNIDLEWIDRFRFIYGSTAMTIILFVLCAGVLLEIRRVKANRGREDLKRIAERMPKLLFNRTLVTMLILSFLAVITMVIFQPRLDQVPSFVKFRENFLPFATFVALVLPFFIGQKITNVVHIARDLIDHQYSPRIETGTYFIPSLRNVRHIRPRRTAIQGRLLALLEQHQVEFEWVEGHVGDPFNERANRLAQRSLLAANLPADEGYEQSDANGGAVQAGLFDLPTQEVPLSQGDNASELPMAIPSSRKVVRAGQACRKCGAAVEKRIPSRKVKPGQRYYYEYYLQCPKCGTIYLVDDAKRGNG